MLGFFKKNQKGVAPSKKIDKLSGPFPSGEGQVRNWQPAENPLSQSRGVMEGCVTASIEAPRLYASQEFQPCNAVKALHESFVVFGDYENEA